MSAWFQACLSQAVPRTRIDNQSVYTARLRHILAEICLVTLRLSWTLREVHDGKTSAVCDPAGYIPTKECLWTVNSRRRNYRSIELLLCVAPARLVEWHSIVSAPGEGRGGRGIVQFGLALFHVCQEGHGYVYHHRKYANSAIL